jgi:glycosyltransferase involved in cell wall biosynthesis
MWSMSIGGAERAVYQLVRGQRARGVRADVLVSSSAGHYGERLRENGVAVHELHQRSGFAVAPGRRIADLLDNYAIAHFHSPELPLVAHVARQDACRICYTHRAGAFRYPLRRSIKYKAVGRVLRKSHSLICANTFQAAHAASRLFRIPADQIPVVYNGIDFDLLKPHRAKEAVLSELESGKRGTTRIGTGGNLRAIKRIDLLLRAIAKLRNPAIQCVVIGDGPARADLERLVSDLELGEVVRFVGTVEHIADYLQVLDVFVLPSGQEESFGNAVVEAMGLGIPSVVCADGGGLTEHVRDGETGFVVSSHAQLASRLELLVEDMSLRRRLGSAGRARVRARYSVEAMVSGYDRLYSQLS